MKRFLFTFFAVVLISFTALAEKEKNVNIYELPRPAPENKFYTSGGQAVTLADFKGSFVMLMHWSRDCRPCIYELENLNDFYKKTKNNGIKIIMISNDAEWKDAAETRKFLDKYDAPDLPFYLDHNNQLVEAFGIFTSPHTVLLNRKGEEIGRIRGTAEWDKPEVIEYIYKLKAKHG